MHPLVSPDWLNAHLHEPDVIVLFTQMRDPATGQPDNKPTAYIPDSVFFDFEDEIVDKQNPLPHSMPVVEQFERQARELGINNSSKVIVYDNRGIYCAPRVWWMLRVMGHSQVAVLNGGLPGWQAMGYPTQAELSAASVSGDFTASPLDNGFVDANYILEGIKQNNIIIGDARSEARFYARVPEPRKGLRSGHMPGAINIPFTECIDNKKLRESKALQYLFQQKSIDNSQRLVFSCGSGVTACILALSATLCGYSNVSVYDGSWTEWGAGDRFPVETYPET